MTGKKRYPMLPGMQRTETLKEQRDRAFLAALKEARSPEEAAVKLGVSVSTVMRFKRKARQGKVKR